MIRRLLSWLSSKPKSWQDLSEEERSAIVHASQAEEKPAQQVVEGEDVFGDAFGASPVSPGSSKIGATTFQRGIGSIMSRRLFEPRKNDDD